MYWYVLIRCSTLLQYYVFPDVCVYNGVPFRQGQTWQDGCGKMCRCEDSMTGLINCDDRCRSIVYVIVITGVVVVSD